MLTQNSISGSVIYTSMTFYLLDWTFESTISYHAISDPIITYLDVLYLFAKIESLFMFQFHLARLCPKRT